MPAANFSGHTDSQKKKRKTKTQPSWYLEKQHHANKEKNPNPVDLARE